MRSVVEARKAWRGVRWGVDEHRYLPWAEGGVLLNYSIWVPVENTAGAWISAVAHARSLNKRLVPHVAALKKNLISLSEIPSVVDGRCRRWHGVNKPGFDLNSSPVPKWGLVLALGTEDAGHVRSPQLAWPLLTLSLASAQTHQWVLTWLEQQCVLVNLGPNVWGAVCILSIWVKEGQ